MALRGLFQLALAGFLRQVVDIVLRHQHLDAVHELFRGSGVAGQDDAFLRQMDLHVLFVDGHPVLEISIEPVRLFNQQHPHRGMGPKIGHHITETGSTSGFGRFHVDIFLNDRKALPAPRNP